MKFWVKTFGWAFISGFLFFVPAVLAGAGWRAALVATLVCVAAKTPFYAVYEWAFHEAYPDDYPKAEPLERK